MQRSQLLQQKLKKCCNQMFALKLCHKKKSKQFVIPFHNLAYYDLEKLFQLKGGSCYIQHIAFIQRIVYIQHIVFLQILTVSTENWMAADLAKTK